ncbi:MAG: hypothetical protein U9Q79_03830, partial [Candidatus Hydrogenedentes bacterium]|nr:hypothetical protein [Candidatus Hydrogenedentota bacterium]
MFLRMMSALLAGMMIGVGVYAQSVPWHQSLSYPGGGYWSVRVPLAVKNASEKPLVGAPLNVTIQNDDGTAGLIGLPAESVRAVTDSGHELLFDVRNPDGVMKRSGTLAVGDVITVPVEANVRASASLFLYAGNPEARPPMDWLNAGLDNPGFEDEGGWDATLTDDTHRMAVQEGGAHSGNSCARCEVDPGAESTWVKYGQGGIPVAEGQRYRFSGWVRAENVKGKAGWFVHVNGEQPQMANRVEGYEGTFDWRKVSIEFEVPEGGRSFSCGTVLHGTGTAWYDGARLDRLSEQSGVAVTVGPAEKMRLETDDASAAWPDNNWMLRVPILLRNFTDEPAMRLFGVDTRRMANAQFKFAGNSWNSVIEVADAAGNPVPADGKFKEDMFVAVNVPPRTEKRVWLYSRSASEKEIHLGPAVGPHDSFAPLSASEWNLLGNGSMEHGDGMVPQAWELPEEGLTEGGRFRMRRVPGGVEGNLCLELQVPETTENPDWFGWRQTVSVKANTQYLLAGFIKGEALDGGASIHLHKHRADGSLTENPFVSTRPEIEGADDWTLTKAVFTTPSDCTSVTLHLTMNHHGTLWHDALTLIESGTAVLGEIETTNEEPPELHAWNVNPLIKTFPHDLVPPRDHDQKIEAYAARNTR